MGYLKMGTLLTVVVVMMVASRVAEGQSTASCASKLVACANYLNSTTRPPSSCCDPLRETVTKELPCLCNLYETPGFLASLGINVTEALRLSSSCGIPGDLSNCNSIAPTSSSVPTTPGVSGNDVGRIGSSGLFSLLLLWASMMLY